MYEESLALRRETGDKWGIFASLYNLGIVAQAHGDYVTAQILFAESLQLAHELGDKRGIANSLNNQGFLVLVLEDYNTAGSLFAESLAYCIDMEFVVGEAYALLGLGLVGLAENRPDARKHILHSLRLRQEIGEQWEQTSSLIGVAGLAVHEGKPQFAAQVLGAVASALEALNAVMEVEMIYFHTQTLAAAREALGESAFQLAWEQGAGWSLEEAVNRALEEITG
jgi:tetratricopeptide (TPR) repeat protein